ncbi:MAG: DUF3089 domain-containing protein [Saprospiraceae bacterium]|nr:DUF3089 domain-containing protein [Saprospiraceae bacterium]
MLHSYWVRALLLLSVMIILFGCRVRPIHPGGNLKDYQSPDYANAIYWAALPEKEDPADALPSQDFTNIQDTAAVDVFFLHPTSYTGDRGQSLWNAELNDARVNQKTDRTSILHQASLFNGVGRVFAPRYRQAHVYSYFTKNDQAVAQKAFEVAYHDIAAAFSYYLEHYNEGRPIILACHSQGTTHGMRLLKEFFEGKPLQDQLVVAYLVGMPVGENYFKEIPVCESPDQTGCFCSWRTFRRGYIPPRFPVGDTIVVVNPLSWTTTHDRIDKTENKGAILRKYDHGIWPELTDAQISQGVLWASKPHFPGSFLLRTKNYHAGDYNLYWVSVRENARLRAQNFLHSIECH